LRVKEEYAPLVFSEHEGRRIGQSVRRVELSTDDPRLPDVAEWERKLVEDGTFLFAGWRYHRRYSEGELASAKAFQMRISAKFEPDGETCGTIYDYEGACQFCGAGRRQVSPLTLDLTKISPRWDIAATIANEWIVSQRFAQMLSDNRATGLELRRVQHRTCLEDTPLDLMELPSGRKLIEKAQAAGLTPASWEFQVWLNRREQDELWEKARTEQANRVQRSPRQRLRSKGKELAPWYQLCITSSSVEASPRTRFGISPFDEDPGGQYRCPRGHKLGLNILSELSIIESSWDRSDLACTRALVGVKRGALVPAPLIVVTPRLRSALLAGKFKGCDFEVAYLEQ
jgi:hypothetical protein